MSQSDRIKEYEKQIALLKAELQQYKEANQTLQQQYQTLKVQNNRLLKKEAEHQSAKMSLLEKRIILSRAVILVPENLVIGDRLENSTIKIYRGNNLTITATGELINCRIIGMGHYFDERTSRGSKPPGTIEIKGLFYNTNAGKFSISTHERVVISPGSRFVGSILAGSIVVNELTRIYGRLATRDLLAEYTKINSARETYASEAEEQEYALQSDHNHE